MRKVPERPGARAGEAHGHGPQSPDSHLEPQEESLFQDGRSLAEKWWKVNITWPWTEDIEPYTIASKYLDYWNVRGGSSNPTIILIDKDGNIAAVYHVYRVGEGEMDGVQKAETLQKDLQ